MLPWRPLAANAVLAAVKFTKKMAGDKSAAGPEAEAPSGTGVAAAGLLLNLEDSPWGGGVGGSWATLLEGGSRARGFGVKCREFLGNAVGAYPVRILGAVPPQGPAPGPSPLKTPSPPGF